MNWVCENCTYENKETKEPEEGDTVFCLNCAESSIIIKTAMLTNRKKLSFNGDGWEIEVGQVYSHPAEAYHISIVRIITPSPNWSDAWIYYVPVNAQDHTEVLGDEADFRAWHLNEAWDLEEDTQEHREAQSEIEQMRFKNTDLTAFIVELAGVDQTVTSVAEIAEMARKYLEEAKAE